MRLDEQINNNCTYIDSGDGGAGNDEVLKLLWIATVMNDILFLKNNVTYYCRQFPQQPGRGSLC